MYESSKYNRKVWLKSHFEQNDHCQLSDKIAKHQKMAHSPFIFFRGSASLFYQDINHSTANLVIPNNLYSIPLTTIIGDCHLSNFGFLTEEGSHGDKVIFTANDFDDACIGHACWDIARFIVSQYLCVLHCQGVIKGDITSTKKYQGKKVINESDASLAAHVFIQQYIHQLQDSVDSATSRDITLNHFQEPHILAKRYEKAVKRASTGQNFYSQSTIAKAVDITSTLKFKQLPDTFRTLNSDEYNEIELIFRSYVDDSILDIVERINAGTGSVNMARYYLLVGPKGATQQSLPLSHIVEVKQQRHGAPLVIAEHLSPINLLNPAHLTVHCQRRMQRRPDLVLDEVQWRQKHWLVRSRHHAKVSIKPEHIGIGRKSTDKGGFIEYAATCGSALALAHCRGDRRSTLFEQSAIKLLNHHKEELIKCCKDYVSQVVTDYELLNELLEES